MAFNFEKLQVWQKAIELTVIIDKLTKLFPKDELYILTSQIKRATDSIALNLAEGSTGQSKAEFIRFINYAIRSGIEVVSCLYIAKSRNLINNDDFALRYKETETLIVMMQALKNSLNRKGKD
jgi:four helix bundle protein